MNVKIFIVSCIISFCVGVGLTGGIGYYFFSKSSARYNSEIQQRENIIKSITDDLNQSKSEIDRITKISGDLTNYNIEAIRILDGVIEYQSQIRQSIQERSIKK